MYRVAANTYPTIAYHFRRNVLLLYLQGHLLLPERRFVPPPLLSRTGYLLCFLLLLVVYSIGLFVPLMDNDSGHHAVIALRMYLTGDYVNLIDRGDVDYLDKPHLHFWLAALSYHLFGVTSFAYKFPSFLFTVAGTYATYRLGSRLYNGEAGRLAALVVASAFAYILSNNDVRMDAILTACVAIATWQLVAWVQEKQVRNVAAAALALALGFCTKGHIAVFTPGISLLFYLAYTRNWKLLWSRQLLLLILLFFVFISPVLYCYYLQFDQHPEKVIRGKSGWSGVKFILWQQNFERLQGDSFGADAKNDYFFFLHSFLWAFAPWSLLAFAAFGSRLRQFAGRKQEWLTAGTFAVLGLVISFSGFKLPHYLNIIFPIAAVMVAGYIVRIGSNESVLKRWLVVQVVLCCLCLVVIGIISVWMFPVQKPVVVIGLIFLAGSAAYWIYQARNRLQRLLLFTVATSVVVFYLLNSNFYPQLLTYQGGNQLAFKTNSTIHPNTVWLWPVSTVPRTTFIQLRDTNTLPTRCCRATARFGC
jgi:4-amino-4-deoxy-L-arabinose transferase-like glycosyltransferase